MSSSLVQTHLKTSRHPALSPSPLMLTPPPSAQICRIRGKTKWGRELTLSLSLSSPNSLCSLTSPGCMKEKGHADLGWRCPRSVRWGYLCIALGLTAVRCSQTTTHAPLVLSSGGSLPTALCSGVASAFSGWFQPSDLPCVPHP